MDTIKASERNWKLGLLADAIQGVYDFGSKPFGYDNPPVKGLLDLATVPSIAKTIDRLSWGDNLTTGKGQTTRILPETADALLAAVPAMNVAERLATKGANYVAKNAGPYLDRTVGGFIEKQIAQNGAPSRYLQDMARGTQSYAQKPSYVGSHSAPMKDSGAPLHDLTQVYPDDIYSSKAAQYYGHGDPALDKGTFRKVNAYRGNPDAPVTMYRAVPNSVPEGAVINNGDWVTINPDYARMHGEGPLGGDYKILQQQVKARKLFTNGDSIHEFGYDESGKINKDLLRLMAGTGLLGSAAYSEMKD